MSKADQRTGEPGSKAVLEFTPSGDLKKGLLIAKNEREEALLRKALASTLRVYPKWRRFVKRTIMKGFCGGLLPQKVTQWLFDLFRLRSV